jgi:hypothetical protein
MLAPCPEMAGIVRARENSVGRDSGPVIDIIASGIVMPMTGSESYPTDRTCRVLSGFQVSFNSCVTPVAEIWRHPERLHPAARQHSSAGRIWPRLAGLREASSANFFFGSPDRSNIVRARVNCSVLGAGMVVASRPACDLPRSKRSARTASAGFNSYCSAFPKPSRATVTIARARQTRCAPTSDRTGPLSK